MNESLCFHYFHLPCACLSVFYFGAVPQCETYSKLKQNERFPLLGEYHWRQRVWSEIRMDGCECFCFHLIAGQQFLVRPDMCVSHHEPIDTRYLCLLCQRMLSNDECYAHVFSREHVTVFLVSIFIYFSLKYSSFFAFVSWKICH